MREKFVLNNTLQSNGEPGGYKPNFNNIRFLKKNEDIYEPMG
jgi:hypothetical protein